MQMEEDTQSSAKLFKEKQKKIQAFQQSFLQNLQLPQIVERKNLKNQQLSKTARIKHSDFLNQDESYCLSDFFTDSPDNDSLDTSNSNAPSEKANSLNQNQKCKPKLKIQCKTSFKSKFNNIMSEKKFTSSFQPKEEDEPQLSNFHQDQPKSLETQTNNWQNSAISEQEEDKTDNLLIKKKKISNGHKQSQLLQLQQVNIDCDFDEVQSINENFNHNELNSTTLQFNANYNILEKLGDGMQGQVFKCLNIQNQQIFAAKTYYIENDDEIKNQIFSEFHIIKNLDHPGILKVYDILDYETSPTIIMEYFEGLNLKDIDAHILKSEDICKIISQLLDIVSYIHQKNIIHRDIQLKNVLFNRALQQIKLIDFGIAKKQLKNQLSLSQCGLRHYQAPEMLNGHQYSEKVDIWQIGQIFYELMEKSQIQSKKIISLIRKNQLPFRNSSEPIQKLILNLLSIKSSQRSDAKDAKKVLQQILSENAF